MLGSPFSGAGSLTACAGSGPGPLQVLLENTTFSESTAQSLLQSGGAVAMLWELQRSLESLDSSLSVSNCTFSNNTVFESPTGFGYSETNLGPGSLFGGGAVFSMVSLLVEKSSFFDNSVAGLPFLRAGGLGSPHFPLFGLPMSV